MNNSTTKIKINNIMYIKTIATLVIYLLLCTSINYAQVHTKGSFKILPIKIDDSKNFIPMLEWRFSTVKDSVQAYFDETRLALIGKTEDGRQFREVYHWADSTKYLFFDYAGKKCYSYRDLKNKLFLDEKVKPKITKIKSNIDTLGFKCDIHKLSSALFDLKVITTNQIYCKLPSYLHLTHTNHFPLSINVSSIKTNGKIEMHSFDFGDIEDSYFDTTTTYLTLREYTDDVATLNSAIESEEQDELDIELKYGTYKSKAINVSLLENILKEPYLANPKCYQQEFRKESDHDLPNVVEIILERRGNENLNRNELSKIFEKHNILSPSIKKVLELFNEDWDYLTRDQRSEIITIAALKDHLASKNIRENITNNFRSIGFSDPGQSILEQSYINGSVSFSDYLANLKSLRKIDVKSVSTKSEMINSINSFYEKASKLIGLPITCSYQESLLMINCKNSNFIIDIDQIWENNISDDYHEDADSSYATLALNLDFYSEFLSSLAQVMSDNNIPLDISLYEPEINIINYNYDNENYLALIEKYKFLDLELGELYLKSIPYDSKWWLYNNDFQLSFPIHPNADTERESLLKNILDSEDTECIKTEDKTRFLEFIKTHLVDLNLSINDHVSIETKCKSSIFYDKIEFINFLPNAYLAESAYSIKTNNAKSLESFDENLYRLVGDNFPGKKFSIEKSTHRIKYSLNGQIKYVNNNIVDMILEINAYFKSINSDKKIYKFVSHQSSNTFYIYLPKDQASKLSELLNCKIY